MGIRFGDIQASQILDNEFRINVLEKILELIVERQGLSVSNDDIQKIREGVVKELKKKYPNSDISLKV